MSQRQPPGIGRTARWLLLACTVFGLAVMHTLGHTGVQVTMADMHPHGPGSPATAAPEMAAAGAPACSDDGCSEHGMMTGWSVCLAVLSGLAIIMLIAVMLRIRRARTATAADRPVTAGNGPRPPPIRAIGLAVASNAVLRI